MANVDLARRTRVMPFQERIIPARFFFGPASVSIDSRIYWERGGRKYDGNQSRICAIALAIVRLPAQSSDGLDSSTNR